MPRLSKPLGSAWGQCPWLPISGGFEKSSARPEILVLNPPRVGLSPQVLSKGLSGGDLWTDKDAYSVEAKPAETVSNHGSKVYLVRDRR